MPNQATLTPTYAALYPAALSLIPIVRASNGETPLADEGLDNDAGKPMLKRKRMNNARGPVKGAHGQIGEIILGIIHRDNPALEAQIEAFLHGQDSTGIQRSEYVGNNKNKSELINCFRDGPLPDLCKLAAKTILHWKIRGRMARVWRCRCNVAIHECNLMLHYMLARTTASEAHAEELRELMRRIAEETRRGSCWAFRRWNVVWGKPAASGARGLTTELV
ncbi:Uu.00g073190.m01.CDS01 [Anthostomella pinea]|uniref:Uu.00g073190.m01.CDS01 n=1 Tax=Anthostomella pinea TaxID=933095 RepID=A0AAI8VV95_9PEZI|nr:Uu.00g073190.m01.CDS01 [Anthostomella pinea]